MEEILETHDENGDYLKSSFFFLYDSVLDLECKLQDTPVLPTENLRQYLDGRHELQDHECLSEYGLRDWPEIDVSIEQTQTPSVCVAPKMKFFFFGMQWFFLVVNALAAGCKASLTELNAHREIRTSKYHKWSAVTACICLVLAFVEFIQELRESNAKWQSKRHCWWFYHQGQGNRLFGRWLLYFNVLSSGIQVTFSFLTLKTNQELLKFDYASLLLAWGNLIAYAIGSKEKTPRCRIHGCDAECLQCKLEIHI